MPADFISKMIETVEMTMRNVEERQGLKRDDRALKGMRNKVTRRIAKMCPSKRHSSLNLDSRSTRVESPGIR
jgi:hypothetical protein